MRQRRWTLLGLVCAFAVMSSQTPAATPTLAPVPLVPSPALAAAWGHVQGYEGTYSADIQSSSAGGWHEHFAGTVTLSPMLPGRPVMAILSFHGSAQTNQSASGYCGSADTAQPAQIYLTLDIASHKYDFHLIPNPGSVGLRGGNASCTKPFATVFPVAQIGVIQALLPAPAAALCGTEIFYRSGSWGSETDTFHWRLTPVPNVHWTIVYNCISIINGAAPLQ